MDAFTGERSAPAGSVRRAGAIGGSIRAWLERFAGRPSAVWALFAVSFVEASLFPISVDVPLIAFGAAAPRRAIRLGWIAAAGSFAGGFLGYLIGFSLYDQVAAPLLRLYGLGDSLARLLALYHDHGLSALVLSGFTPIPYVAFTYTAGFARTLDLPTLALGAAAGRALRFVPVGVILRLLGPRAANFLFGRWFYAAAALIVVSLILLRWAL